ncbi:flagellar hook-length control protein FliK [Rhodopirellula sallentina]|uniref:Flagellar hook-length control protein n=1 Tax=Rhodopirellula sallentina SM41 TaxID=1263870 RepID=M5U7H6_9BACT|nr:flagellar hook-length control protein FliK [Rhodopirellula sallentina]EMI57395.1 Flagellar hook-length control protein [Rhodopirellula sallentina SM41]
MTSNQTSSVSQSASRTSGTLAPTRNDSAINSLRRRFSAANLGEDKSAAGLGDPFAEIFASIAAAETPVPEPTQTVDSQETDESTVETQNESEDHSDDDAQRTDEAQSIVAANDALLVDGAENPEAEESEAVALVESETIDEALGDAEGETEASQQVDLSQDGEESESEAPVVVAETQSDEAEAVVDSEWAAASTDDQSRRRSDANTAEDIEIESEAVASDELEQVAAKSTRETESADAEPDGDTESAVDHGEPGESKVERRRYTKRSEQPTNQDSQQETGAEEPSMVAGDPAKRDASSQTSRTGAGSRSGGIDISGMTPTASGGAAPAGAAAAAAVSAVTSGAGAASAGRAAGGASSIQSVTGASSGAGDGSASADGSAPTSGANDASQRSGREGSSAAAAKGNTGHDTSSAVQRAKLVQRVSRGFQHLGSSGGQIRMKLAPEHLGSVQLQMKVQNGELSGTMVTQSDAAAQMLREQLPDLRAALENQGIKLQRIDIETDSSADAMKREADGQTGDQPSGQGSQQFTDGQAFAGGRHRSGWSDVTATPRNTPSEKNTPKPPALARVATTTPGRVDLQV